MLLYSHILSAALNEEALPVLRDMFTNAMREEYGPNWYESAVKPVFVYYQDYDKIAPAIAANPSDPAAAFDITALFFLFSPYVDGQALQGFRQVLVARNNLNEWQDHKLDKIRYIRNSAAHPATLNTDPSEKEAEKNGTVEKEMLDDLEKILKSFRPSASLYDYKSRLQEEVARKASASASGSTAAASSGAASVPGPTIYMQQTEAIRPTLMRMHRAEYFEAKLHTPLKEEAPWTVNNADLHDLPWPSEVLAQLRSQQQYQQQNYQSNQNAGRQPYGAGRTNGSDPVTQAVDKVSDFLSGLFGK